MLKSLGATHVLSRKLSATKLESSVKEITNGKPLDVIYDAVALPETQQAGYDILADDGTLAVVLAPDVCTTEGSAKKVIRIFCMVHAPQNRDLGIKLYAKLPEWLKDGSIVVSSFIIFTFCAYS